MSDATRHGGTSPAGSGTAFPPAPASPPGEQQRTSADWDGDHARYAAEPEEPEIGHEIGIDPAGLADEDLLRELGSLHRTRLHTLRHGPDGLCPRGTLHP